MMTEYLYCNAKHILFDPKYDQWVYETKPDWCPLVEVDKHED